MKIVKVFGADIYRDGGSYGFCFYADDGHWYEFFLQVKTDELGMICYQNPTIYFEGRNSERIVQRLDWKSARDFILSCHCDENRFHEIVTIVNQEGRRV